MQETQETQEAETPLIYMISVSPIYMACFASDLKGSPPLRSPSVKRSLLEPFIVFTLYRQLGISTTHIMMALKGCRWPLLFLLAFSLLQIHLAEAVSLQTLKRYSACISPCFEACDPDYSAECVCNLLIQDPFSVDATVTCIGQYCNPEFAAAIFPDFGKECSIFLNKPVIFNGKAIQTLPMPTPSATRVGIPTQISTYIPELTPTASPPSTTMTTSISDVGSTALPTSVQTGLVPPTESGVPGEEATTDPEVATKGTTTTRPLIAVYVLVPIILVVILVAIFFIWRRRNHQRSVVNASGWDSSQNPIVGEPVNTRGEEEFTIRIVPRSISQLGGRTPSPRPAYPPPIRQSSVGRRSPHLAYPPPARQPSMGRRAKDFARRFMDKELPGLPLSLSITTISETSEAPRAPPERDARTHRTTDSEDELRRVYREVRKGFRSQSTASSAVTSLDWSVMGGTSQTKGFGG